MKKHHMIGRTVIYASLTLAILLAAAGMRTSRTTIKLAGKSASISELDQRARPYFLERSEKEIHKEREQGATIPGGRTQVSPVGPLCDMGVVRSCNPYCACAREHLFKLTRGRNYNVVSG